MFGKRPSELVKADIQRLVAEKVQEGTEIEFKETLPAKKGVDPWLEGTQRIGEYARDQLLEEVIAFANAYGGTLIVGISESDDKPARAAEISVVPECAELAERLKLQCRDCIEPQVPLLEVAGVRTANDGSGVVVFHVPRSRIAPHRHTKTRECYIRRADRSEKMTMREIQELTLQVERGLVAIETTFDKRGQQFLERFEDLSQWAEHAFGLRTTLVPLTPLNMERVHSNHAVQPLLQILWGTIKGSEPYKLYIPVRDERWRPILRGTRGTGGTDHCIVEREAHCDGIIEYLMLCKKTDKPLRLYAGWVMGLLGNTLCAAERFRQGVGAPEVEYGLEFEINNRGDKLLIGRYGDTTYEDYMGSLEEERSIFPRYPVGPPDQFQSITELFYRDFLDAAGHDVEETITIDYERAFAELGM